MLDDIRECPATWSLAASWVLVFALMHWSQANQPMPEIISARMGPGAILPQTSHRFGDMTWGEVRAGEPWRLVTATFIHFSLIHLGLNLIGLVKLGRLVEPWYGPGPFLGVCLTIGGLGNLFGGAGRHWVAALRARVGTSGLASAWPGLVRRVGGGVPPEVADAIPTGGGSTILLGLLGLGAVVGWRSRTRIGSFLRDEMLVLLGLTALLGVAMSSLVDNYGHAGGAIAGAAVGFAHRPLFRLAERRAARRVVWALALGLSAACLVAAGRADRSESALLRDYEAAAGRSRADVQALQDLERLFILYGRVIARAPDFREPHAEADAIALGDLLSRGPALGLPPGGGSPDPAKAEAERIEMGQALDRLDRLPNSAWGDPIAADLGRIVDLVRAATVEVPRFDQAYEFVVRWRSAWKAILADHQGAGARIAELERRARGTK